MAKVQRVSGRLKIELSFNDRTDQYKARICPMVRGEKCETVYVKSHFGSRDYKAVDSAAAYTKAAHAAITFAREDIQSYADSTRSGSGWMIRKPRPAKRRR